MSRKKSTLFFLYIPIGLALLILIAYTVIWNIGARGMKQAVYDWIEDQRENGMVINHGKISTGGYPFFLRTKVHAVEMKQPDQWQWQSEALAIDALPYDLTRIIFSPMGEQKITFATVPVPFGTWRGEGDKIRASLGQKKGQKKDQKKNKSWFFKLELNEIDVNAVYTDAQLQLGKLLINIGPSEDDKTTIASSLKLDDFYANVRGDGIERVIRFGVLQSSIDLTQTDKMSGEDSLSAWSGKGGKVQIHYIILEDDPAQFLAKGSINVDGQGYPAGLIETQITKPGNFVKTIQNSNLIPADQADALAGGVAIAALSSGGVITTPILLKDGQVSVNGNVVSTLAPIQP